ncbi:ABC transporter ATP-binding protein [Patescibacteria group bacterium]|nr:ABC transporter ATP-binding protein [Patescibacteria group bacterium]
MTRGDVLIELIGVTKSYPIDDGKSYQAIRGISLKIRKGEFVSVMGPSGSGKSTLMHILGALDTVTTGTYTFQGKEISRYSPDEIARIRNKEIGFVFQSFNLLPRTTVFKNVERPMIYGGVPRQERKTRAMDALRVVGIAGKADNLSNKISGGEAQRVAIARALIMNPSVILTDEPTGNLDSATSRDIMHLLTALHEKGSTVVVITHDPTVAAYAHRRIRIVDGKIIEDKTSR